ncbi:hypothetical protein POM88_035614 [Heracleum sosnowskyi]|uniref:Uncharacterized protein n=1 Tax=Heracleum sosnowskyi TaxID=360622 RepID=A0AAD8HNN7_9APIA|nr:hypothetical protein POM88_035614 [Heracleum sosnowskyi]
MGDYNYVATSLPCTRVDCSVAGNFTDDMNLILGKGNRLEIYVLMDESLKKLLDLQLCGRIKFLKRFHPHGDCREKGRFTKSHGHRVKEQVQTCSVDPDGKLIALYMFYNIVTLIPFENGELMRPLDRDVAAVKDIKFLFGSQEPTISVLCQVQSDMDANLSSKLITYKFNLENGTCT